MTILSRQQLAGNVSSSDMAKHHDAVEKAREMIMRLRRIERDIAVLASDLEVDAETDSNGPEGAIALRLREILA